MATCTVGDLLQFDLGLELVVGDDASRRRRVVDAHSIELERPGAWLDRDWLVLTNGLRLHDRPDRQRALVDDLVGTGVAGIGFGLGVPYDHPPSALLEEAERRGLPVLSIPRNTPFREVIRSVQRAQSDRGEVELQRLSAMQLQLMHAVGTPEPRSAVVGRLAELLSATVVLLSARGEVLEHAGDERVAGLWDALGGKAGPVATADLGDRDVTAVPLHDGSSAGGWLAVISPAGRSPVRLTRPAIRATAPLLAALARIDATAAGRERAVRRALLDELLDPAPDRELELRARAAQLGLVLGDVTRVVVIVPPPTGGAELVEAWEATLDDARIPQLTTGGEEGFISLVACELPPLTGALRRYCGATSSDAGVGRATAHDAAGVGRSLREARIAASAAPMDRATPIVEFERLDLATCIAGLAAGEDVVPLIDALLAPVKTQPHLHETLVTWMANDCDVSASAAALCLRPNSVRYRLSRIEHSLGVPLRRPSTIASLHIALAFEKLFADRLPEARRERRPRE